MKLLVCVQLNFVEHLRFFKGLQDIVSEPGGEVWMQGNNSNTLVQRTAVKNLSLNCPLIFKNTDLKLSLFKRGWDDMIKFFEKLDSVIKGVELEDSTPLASSTKEQDDPRCAWLESGCVKGKLNHG